MKKVFALVLAVAMVMSMSAVSFAKAPVDFEVAEGQGNEVNDGITHVGTTPYEYNADENWMRLRGTYQYGKAVYFPLLTDNADAKVNGGQIYDGSLYLISKQDVVEGLKAKADFEMGKELVESINIVKKKVERIGSTSLATAKQLDGGYYYFIELKTVSKETTSDSDIVCTIELDKTKKGDIADTTTKDFNLKVKDFKVDISVNIGYNNNYVDSAQEFKITEGNDAPGDGEFEPETYYLLKYNYDDEAEFTFGLDPNEGTFTVDVSGQGKNLLYFDTKLDDAIADANKDAKIFALNFNNTKFNRTGEFVYEAEDMGYAYEVLADGSLKLLGEFDGDEVSFKTRVLGKYLFSDIELVAAAKDEPVVTPSEVPTVEVTNPTTGAIA